MNELAIKKILVNYISQRYTQYVISSEFSFQFGERRADIALLESDNLTAFEIKSARDKTSRLNYQIESYKNFFDFCYVVCEIENLPDIRLAIPKDVGILLVKGERITHCRQSKHFKRHEKLTLCSTLTIQKLINLAKNSRLKSKHELCNYISKKYSVEFLRKLSRSDFEEKHSTASRLMQLESTTHLSSDDIYTITKRGPSLLTKRSLS